MSGEIGSLVEQQKNKQKAGENENNNNKPSRMGRI